MLEDARILNITDEEGHPDGGLYQGGGITILWDDVPLHDESGDRNGATLLDVIDVAGTICAHLIEDIDSGGVKPVTGYSRAQPGVTVFVGDRPTYAYYHLLHAALTRAKYIADTEYGDELTERTIEWLILAHGSADIRASRDFLYGALGSEATRIAVKRLGSMETLPGGEDDAT